MAQYTLTSSSLSVLVIIRSSDVAETWAYCLSLNVSLSHSKQGFIQNFILEGCKQESWGVTYGYTRHLLTYLLTYLLTWMLQCISSPPEIWPLHFCPIKVNKTVLLAVSVKWIRLELMLTRSLFITYHTFVTLITTVYWFTAADKLNSVVLVYTP